MRMSSQRNATLRIATSQFPVSHDLGRNTKYVLRQMRDAKSAGADVVHFPEGALSGYAGTDFDSFRGFDWSLLRSCSQRVLQRAAELELWVLLGSSHPLSPRHEPHNCVYVIDPAFYGRFGFRAGRCSAPCVEGHVVRNEAVRERRPERKRLEVRRGYVWQDEPRLRAESEAPIEGRIAQQHAASGAAARAEDPIACTELRA